MTAGGHWFDTGDGPQPISATSAMIQQTRAQLAYQAYLDHRPTCPQCQQTVFICAAAVDLWEAYKVARGAE
jgi:hypothetical protein